jgi:hypothetical protein
LSVAARASVAAVAACLARSSVAAWSPVDDYDDAAKKRLGLQGERPAEAPGSAWNARYALAALCSVAACVRSGEPVTVVAVLAVRSGWCLW